MGKVISCELNISRFFTLELRELSCRLHEKRCRQTGGTL